jgi:hypothetical protein
MSALPALQEAVLCSIWVDPQAFTWLIIHELQGERLRSYANCSSTPFLCDLSNALPMLEMLLLLVLQVL